MDSPSSDPTLEWTGVGSLPFADLDEAFDHVTRAYPALPFCPETADSGEGMIADALPRSLPLGGPAGYGVKLAHIGAQPEVESAFAAIEAAEFQRVPALRMAARAAKRLAPSDDRLLKAQVAGPVTILQGVRDAGSNPLWVYPDLHGPVARWCAALAREMALTLLEHAENVAMFLDEPILGLGGDVATADALPLLEPAVEVLRNLDVAVGLHCCSAPPCELAATLDLDYLSIDGLRYRDELLASGPILGPWLEGRGRLVLGVIAPLSEGPDVSPTKLVDDLAQACSLDRSALLSRLVLSPTCGTRLTPADRERTIAARLAEWAHELPRETP